MFQFILQPHLYDYSILSTADLFPHHSSFYAFGKRENTALVVTTFMPSKIIPAVNEYSLDRSPVHCAPHSSNTLICLLLKAALALTAIPLFSL